MACFTSESCGHRPGVKSKIVTMNPEIYSSVKANLGLWTPPNCIKITINSLFFVVFMSNTFDLHKKKRLTPGSVAMESAGIEFIFTPELLFCYGNPFLSILVANVYVWQRNWDNSYHTSNAKHKIYIKMQIETNDACSLAKKYAREEENQSFFQDASAYNI